MGLVGVMNNPGCQMSLFCASFIIKGRLSIFLYEFRRQLSNVVGAQCFEINAIHEECFSLVSWYPNSN